MKCTGKEWDTCRVEKMGCTGCYYDEIEVDEYIRTEKGYIFKVDNQKKVLKGIKILDVQFGKIKKHSKNIIDLIEIGDYVNGELVAEIYLDYFGENNTKTRRYGVITKNYKRFKQEELKTIVTKELFKKTQYKVGE